LEADIGQHRRSAQLHRRADDVDDPGIAEDRGVRVAGQKHRVGGLAVVAGKAGKPGLAEPGDAAIGPDIVVAGARPGKSAGEQPVPAPPPQLPPVTPGPPLLAGPARPPPAAALPLAAGATAKPPVFEQVYRGALGAVDDRQHGAGLRGVVAETARRQIVEGVGKRLWRTGHRTSLRTG